MTAEEAIIALCRSPHSAKIQKLARTTLIMDCHKSLWAFLRLTAQQVRPLYAPYLQVKDLPHDIWYCQLSTHARAYGKTFPEAVERAMASTKGDLC